jgi:transposase
MSRGLLLPSMNPFPGDFSILVLDNAADHHSDVLQQLCDEAGAISAFPSPPYSPFLNPIENALTDVKGLSRALGVSPALPGGNTRFRRL